jgi:hypothetical protein
LKPKDWTTIHNLALKIAATWIIIRLDVVQLVEVKGFMRQWDPSKSLVGQETPATNVVLQFETEALKIYKELGQYFRRVAKISRARTLHIQPRAAKGVQSRFVPPDRVRRSSPHIVSLQCQTQQIRNCWLSSRNKTGVARLKKKLGLPS